jgi:hypothetical protein
MKKKSRIELAREIIANLRRGMNRPLNDGEARNKLAQATPIATMNVTTMNASRSKRPNQLQTSHP